MPWYLTVIVVLTALATCCFVMLAALVITARGKQDYERYREIQYQLKRRS